MRIICILLILSFLTVKAFAEESNENAVIPSEDSARIVDTIADDVFDFNALIVFGILILFIILMFKGIIKTFQRHPVVAILCIIFLFPAYCVWAFVELFTGPINRSKNND